MSDLTLTKKKDKSMLAGKHMTVAELASLGGKARSAKLTPERRKEIARNAARKRWASAKRETDN